MLRIGGERLSNQGNDLDGWVDCDYDARHAKDITDGSNIEAEVTTASEVLAQAVLGNAN